jgi:tRNA (mo5U34)-methyltransferase
VGRPDGEVDDRESLQAQIDRHAWFHSIPLGQGLVTKGLAAFTWDVSRFPDFAGRTVLDIGAWDGGYSFMAERHGASRVVALDHYAWGVDFLARDAYWRACAEQGILPDPGRDTTDFWNPDLPARRPFEFARNVLHSRVEPVLGDFTTMALDELGVFDVVLYLGVLYHMKDPLTSLERVRHVTAQVAVIETVALNVPGLNDLRLLQFHPGGELNTDFGNWFVPTLSALVSMCRVAGFSSVEVVVGPPEPPSASDLPARTRRSFKTPWRVPAAPDPPPPEPIYRALIHAYA